MQRKQCVIIPVYNHHQFIESTIEKLLPYTYGILLIDDGSIEECHQLLEQLKEKYQLVTLFTLPENQGKGAAVAQGLLEAKKLGYTHALQIDADGQHNSDDIARFTTLSEQYPHDVISGQPVYDDSIPKGRLYGRYITHFWVWVETLSFSIKDSMCGFRIYPVNECCSLIEKTPLGKRMDFDTEILVRLYWNGVKTHFVDTHVTYPEDGVSHFKMLRDNCQISWMHTRLVCGMLLRLPLLIWQKLRVKAA